MPSTVEVPSAVCSQCGYMFPLPGADPNWKHYICPRCLSSSKDETSKPTNPKDAIGSDKLPLHLWPETATVHGTLALLDGALKYGRANWRHDGARASIYYDACRRHLDKWFEGTTTDPDSGLHHLAHALASLAIILDAEAQGVLVDDRQFSNGDDNFEQFVADLTPHVKRMKAEYANRDPKHWTIKDTLDKTK